MSRATLAQTAVLIGLMQLPGLCAGWDPKLAADYLDSRQKEWAAWPAAAAPGGTCLSCHTGMTYLLARPGLRRILNEPQATPYEKGLLDGLRSRVERKESKDWYPPFTKEPLSSEALGVETIFAALFLAQDDHGRASLSPKTEQAFDRMWALQIHDGKARGSWNWFQLDLDPWETTDSPFYGAAVAALAVGAAPSAYRDRPEIREHILALTAYLHREASAQPLHNRLMLLWVSSALPGAIPETTVNRVIKETLASQQADGGWTIDSLGSWKKRPQAPPSVGSNAYATAFTTYVLLKAGAYNPQLNRALDWLRAHQDARGFWEAASMNKHFTPDSMQDQFMRDAATGFATLALVEAGEPRSERSAR